MFPQIYPHSSFNLIIIMMLRDIPILIDKLNIRV